MAKDISVNQLASAVMLWLSYSSSVGRDYVLSESAIKFPVAEYLNQAVGKDKIQLEFGHPKLHLKRFDLFFENNKNENNVFEFKYIKNNSTRSTDEKQRVFNDLMRLHLYLEDNHKAYFLICGNQLEFISDFKTLAPKPKDNKSIIKERTRSSAPKTSMQQGFYTEWFNFDNDTPKVIEIKNATGGYKEIYKKFLSEYKDPYLIKTGNTLELPNEIITKRVFMSNDFQNEIGNYNPSKIGIWEILKTKGN